MPISSLLGSFPISPRLFLCTLNLHPYSLGVNIIMSIANSTIIKTILLHLTMIPVSWIIFSPVGIYCHIIASKPYTTYSMECSILPHKMYQVNNCSHGYNMLQVSLFDNPDGSLSNDHWTMRIILPCWDHNCIVFIVMLLFPLVSCLAPLLIG